MKTNDMDAHERLQSLLRRQEQQHQVLVLQGESAEAMLDAFEAGPGVRLLACLAEPQRNPESQDLAVLLPEIAVIAGAEAVAVAPPALAERCAARHGVTRWPTLVLLRDGSYVGAIDGLRDWVEYRRLLTDLDQAPRQRPPGVGVPVVAAGALT